MKKIQGEMQQRKEFLRQVIREKEQSLKSAPEGILNISANDKRTQYYYKDESPDSKRKYLRTNQLPLIKKLCQKEYDQKVLQLAQKEVQLIEKYLKFASKQTCEDVFDHLVKQRQKHIVPIILPDEEYVAEWESFEYIKKDFRYDTPEYYTDKDERVRSKSEILIANALTKHNIPYRYEAPIYLNGYGTVYPDFTILNIRLRKELFWEHLGMMDDASYVEKALEKIDTYQKNNIFPGEKLILTHESAYRPLNTRIIDRMIECHCI